MPIAVTPGKEIEHLQRLNRLQENQCCGEGVRNLFLERDVCIQHNYTIQD